MLREALARQCKHNSDPHCQIWKALKIGFEFREGVEPQHKKAVYQQLRAEQGYSSTKRQGALLHCAATYGFVRRNTKQLLNNDEPTQHTHTHTTGEGAELALHHCSCARRNCCGRCRGECSCHSDSTWWACEYSCWCVLGMLLPDPRAQHQWEAQALARFNLMFRDRNVIRCWRRRGHLSRHT